MGEQPTSRAGVAFVAFGVAVFGLVALVFFWGAGIACEDAATEDFNTVRCATEGADGWKTFQVVLLCGAAAAFVGGTIWSLAKRRMAGVAIGAIALIAAFVAAFAINYKHVDTATADEAIEPTTRLVTILR